jgi:hypothetical protein
MKLSKAAILAIRGFGSDAKKQLAGILSVSQATLYRYIQDNDDCLTKAAALDFIGKETGLETSEILENETEGAQK